MPQGMGPITDVAMRGVSRHFGSTVALRGVDVSFTSGQITSLEGPNGSGKSTLLGILGTVLPPTRGEVLYDGKRRDPSEVRGQIGWLSHETHCYADLCARSNLQFAAALYGAGEGAWAEAAQRFGVDAFAEQTFRRLSRGQRQRTALARAMVHRPSLLLLDEPTNGLDVDGTERLVAALLEEVGRGNIVVMVTHDGGLAARLGARRLLLERGRLRSDTQGSGGVALRSAPT